MTDYQNMNKTSMKHVQQQKNIQDSRLSRLFLESVTKNVTKPQKLITENFVVTQTQET